MAASLVKSGVHYHLNMAISPLSASMVDIGENIGLIVIFQIIIIMTDTTSNNNKCVLNIY